MKSRKASTSASTSASKSSTANKGHVKKQNIAGESVHPEALDSLVQHAKEVRKNAYAPFSKYKVGAAILTKSGNTYRGCNVENSTFGATLCAERSAIAQMIASGDHTPVACAVVTADGGAPCGICRQVLAEFATDMPIVLVALASASDETGAVVHLSELLPHAFRLAQE